MCILLIHANEDAKPGQYRLIIAANHDEFFNRPRQPAFHCKKHNIIGGRDLKPERSGGMFMGLACKNNANQGPKICICSLIHIGGHKEAESMHNTHQGRGALVSQYLENVNEVSGKEYLQNVYNNTKMEYKPFNLIITEMDEFGKIKTFLDSNFPRKLAEFDNTHYVAIGNTPYDSPLTKVTRGKEFFEDIVAKNLPRDELIEEIYELLKNQEMQLPDHEMQRRVPDLAQHLCSIFVKAGSAYGTRTHTIILVDYDFNVEYIESSCDVNTLHDEQVKWTEQKFKTQLC